MSMIFESNSTYNSDNFRSFLENKSVAELSHYAKEHQEQKKKIEEFVSSFFNQNSDNSLDDLRFKATFLLSQNSQVLNTVKERGLLKVESELKDEALKIIFQTQEKWRIPLFDSYADSDNLYPTPLHLACQLGDETLIKELIKKNIDVNKKDESGNTALHYYCKYSTSQNLKIIKLFIRAGADLNEQNSKGVTALHAAIKKNNLQLAQYLINHGSSLSLKEKSGNTPLDLLCNRNEEKQALHLLKNFCEKGGLDPFEMALRLEQNDLAFLLAKETKQNHDIVTVLEESKQTKTNPINVVLNHEFSTIKPKLDVIHFFIEKGSPLNAVDQNAMPPLHLAIKGLYESGGKSMDIIKKLIEAGADPNQVGPGNQSALHYAALHKPADLELINLLIKEGASLHQQDKEDYTPLHLALLADSSNLELVKLLIGDGTSLKQKDYKERTPLNFAIQYGVPRLELTKLLIGDGSSLLLADHKGRTPIHTAFRYGYSSIERVELLIGDGSALSLSDNQGRTPLYNALDYVSSNLELIKLMIEAGANLDLPDKNGITCLQLIEGLEINIPFDIKKFEFTYESRLRKLLANAWSMNWKTSFENQHLTIDLSEGGTKKIGSKESLRLFQAFANHSKQNSVSEKSFNSLEESLNNGRGEYLEVLEKFEKGKTLRFLCGWQEHAIDVTISGNYLLICNRGDKRKKASVKAIKIDRKNLT